MPSTSVNVIDLGSCGSVLQFTCDVSDEEKEVTLWRNLIVLDISGSMGMAVRHIIQSVIPKVLDALGTPQTQENTLITFDSVTEVHRMTYKDFQGSTIMARGTTCMAGAVLEAANELANHDVPYRLIVVSDGAIGDRDQTLNEAATIRKRTGMRTAPIRVCQIRLETSTYGSPDTQALTCLGQLDSYGCIDLYDVKMWGPGMASSISILAQQIVTALKGESKLFSVSSSQGAVLARLPGGIVPYVDKMQVARKSTILMKPGSRVEDLAVNEISIDSSRITRVDRITEEDLSDLLLMVESQVKQLMVIGGSKEQIDLMLKWVDEVSNIITPQGNDERTSHKASTMLRRKKLIANLGRHQKTILQRLKEIGNAGMVNTLNATMQAEFLRGVSNSNQGKSLAKRAARMGEVDYEGLVEKEIEQILNAEPLQEKREDLISFYSLDTPASCLNGISDIPRSQTKLLGVSELMQVVGPLGISFQAKSADAPDPWACFSASKVFAGESRLLNSADLWTSRMQSGDGHEAQLFAPGTHDEITGVLPLRSLAPESYDRLQQLAPTLMSLHVSASLRGSLVPMPGDLGAMATSCCVRLARQLSDDPTSATAQTLLFAMNDLNSNLKKKLGMSPEVILWMNGEDPRLAMAGDLNIASELKPFAGILAGVLQPKKQLADAILGYVYYLGCNRKYDSPEARTRTIQRFSRKLLEISEKRDVPVGEIFSPDPDVENLVYREFSSEFLHQHTDPSPFKTLSCVWAARAAYDKSPDDVPKFLEIFKEAVRQPWSFVGVQSQEEVMDILSALYLQALQCPNLSSRIEVGEDNNRTCKLPDVTDEQSSRQYVSDLVRSIYTQRYHKNIREKREGERKILSEKLVSDLLSTTTEEEFIRLLSRADNTGRPLLNGRSGDVWDDVIQNLLQSNVKSRTMKLWVLLTGRDHGEEPVFCQGNAIRSKMAAFQTVFEAEGAAAEWTQLTVVLKKYARHIYREGLPNRHGHSNEFPSYWARGFDSLDDFQRARPEEAAEYIEKRLLQGKLWAKSKKEGKK
ncbi:hypothetical protein PROFUN_03603 [Planoprotostelium fungivorum]|uniref:VWFA domain-containing protein n=1 Tax=Planoprotostelium fungivorum TaxID=1890364 RepID=A0A2P6MSJ4_9EUKA|nr:hypothetical protein PROFUN_03603 [Planoprotostelium fungivorum]